jgi:hypothetical protein
MMDQPRGRASLSQQPPDWRAVKRLFHMFTPFAANVGDEGER